MKDEMKDPMEHKMEDEMEDEIEKALKAALQREPAPEGFSAKVLRAASAYQPPASRWWRLPWWRLSWWRLPSVRWAAVGVAALACVVAAVSEHERQQRIRGLEARQQVLLALHITGSKLRVVQDQVLKTHAGGDDRP